MSQQRTNQDYENNWQTSYSRSLLLRLWVLISCVFILIQNQSLKLELLCMPALWIEEYKNVQACLVNYFRICDQQVGFRSQPDELCEDICHWIVLCQIDARMLLG